MTQNPGDLQLLASMVITGLIAMYVVWRWCCVISEMRADAGSDEAEQRAHKLLLDVLTADEAEELEATGALVVRSPGTPGRTYRIPSAGGSVVAQEPNGASMLLCVQPVSRLPRADLVLMHKLMIEGNEQEYLRVANIQRDPYPRPPVGFRGLRGGR